MNAPPGFHNVHSSQTFRNSSDSFSSSQEEVETLLRELYEPDRFDCLSDAFHPHLPDETPYCRPYYPMSRAKHWCFTLNNYTQADLDRLSTLHPSTTYLVYGREISSTGTPHLQGFVSFAARVRLAAVIATIGQAHCSVARQIAQAIEYCKKDGDYEEFGESPTNSGKRNDLDDFKSDVVAGCYDFKVLREKHSEVFAKYPRFCIDYVADNAPTPKVPAHPLRDWQQTLYSDLQRPPDDRHIIFIVDYTGNTGKSWFCHYYAQMNDKVQVLLPGKKADMCHVLKEDIRVVFIDAPRSKQGEFLQYDFLEEVKNGYVFSPKYESRLKRLGKVHVVVMMNEQPDASKLSTDRYDIRVI